jgi:antitoxin YefM
MYSEGKGEIHPTQVRRKPMQALSISEARKRLFELRDQVVNNSEQIVVTHKKGNMVMISMDEWEAYQETFRLLNDQAALKAVLQSFDDREHGRRAGKTPDAVFGDLEDR